ncbi:RmlC-like jelly roll fold [Sesbania bispinosa]|nr:RmlC-like jelly roll fold [Sesbania bispinosa]
MSSRRRKMKIFGISCGDPKEEIDDKENQNKEDGSQYSLTGILLPSLGATAARESRRPKLCRFIISPSNHHYKLWQKFLVVLVFYTAWVCPFEFGFLENSKGALAITDNIVNALFLVDIVLTFFVAYLDKYSYVLIDNRKLIAWRYAKSWLILDVIASIPYEVVHSVLPPSLRTYGYLSILRLWRLHKVSAMFARHDPKSTWLGLVPDAANQSLLGRYVTSVYWSIVTLSSVGYGDLHPIELKDITDIEGLQQQEIIDSLPKAIQSSISHYLFYSLVDKVMEMKAEYFPPKEDVILQNEAPTDFYILVTGAVVVGEAKTGDVVGEIGVLCYRPQPFTVRTKRLCQLLRLNRTTFLNLAHSNVGDGTIITNNFLQHLNESKDPMMEGILAETEAMVARGKMDLPVSLLFAASRGDDILLHQLLKKGSDPNETDKNNGKTALHIAASIGNEHCVVLLLEYGANPNIQDLNGSVPLWEAMVGRYESIMKLLKDNGTDISSADVGHFACIAVEKNDIKLLKDIVQYGGDVTQSTRNGTTALHAAVCEGNVEIVKFLLDQGANIDKQDDNGWTPRAFADHQCHEEIQNIFQGLGRNKKSSVIPPIPKNEASFVGKCQSEPFMPGIPQGSMPPNQKLTWFDNHQRRRASPFHNSFFGMMSAANHDYLPSQSDCSTMTSVNELSARVTLSCPEKGEHAKKLVFLPKSLQELLHLGAKKFDFSPTKILTKEGAEVDDINVIRDGDYLILARD